MSKNRIQNTDYRCFCLMGDRVWKTNVEPLELYKVKKVAIALVEPPDSKHYLPVHKLEFNEAGDYVSHETEEDWGSVYCTFPPKLRHLIEVARWSSELLNDCYGYGYIIEQRICVLERFS